MSIYHIVYKTTNLLNGIIYIGRHECSSLDDGYLGSGFDLKKAIKEFGKENFSREILFIFDNYDDMNRKEAELVTPEFCLREDTYNRVNGGGGYGRKGIPHTEETKRKLSESSSRVLVGRPVSAETREKISKAHKGRVPPSKGKTLSEEHRRKISESAKNRPPVSEESKRKMSESRKRYVSQNSDQTHNTLLG